MASMTTRAAVLHQPGTDWEITELDLDEPKDYEVLIRYKAAGLCHSDEHIRAEGGSHIRMPLVGGHEGAGIVEAVGPGVTRVKPGDHVVTSYIPACGKCRYCSTGHQNLCDRGLYAGVGCLQDETFRFHRNGEDYGGFCALGTFSDHTVVSEYSCVRIDDDIPFEVACLVGCGVTTGWCSAVRAGDTRPGETVVIMGVGGVGINAVQGAAYAGARDVVVIDPNPFKLDAAKRLGATHAFTGVEEAREELIGLTRGQMADLCVVTVGVLEPEITADAVSLIGKAGRVILTSVSRADVHTVSLTGSPLVGWHKRIQGSLAGGANPIYEMPNLLSLYRSGHLKLDEIITARYSLEQVNEGYHDLLAGKNIRGVILHES
ncbi:MAG TPA: NDMA-dependent alcohol dehydrogenase [Solirubrobacteraceae bacterium]|jgi:S-(hydroxymethyl)glutathione dehydrogenase/alcohol dehydrogenase|nr:NDMA-dependent alcohol dehydrogenase [Solirubrobacteraceae bacterium]